MFNEGVLLGFVTAICWGISPLLYRWGGIGLSPIEINFIRNTGALASVLLINLILKTWDHLYVHLPIKGWVIFCISLILGLFIGDNFFFKGLKLIGVSRCTVVSSSYPIITIAIAYFLFKERITMKLLIACLIVIWGIYLLYEKRGNYEAITTSLKGYIISMGAAISWGTSLALVKMVSYYFTPISFMTWRVGILLIITSISVLLKKDILSTNIKNIKNWSILSLGGTIGIGISYLAFIRALQMAPVSQIGVITATSPLITSFLATIFYKERLGLRGSIGSVFIVTGSILASI
ncbi:MAG: DMT family transporter [Synergistetes bacterium]|nr:DMT family transporter [Synergistota bacterium]MCX8128066.1 DMT family transporter [Synergistota bacterium]MDW8193160.1 DMT family transporter [Synergistota bacterium]